MRSRGRGSIMLPAAFLGALAPSQSEAIGVSDGFLRRKRLDQVDVVPGQLGNGLDTSLLLSEDALEQLWDKAAADAELDTERLLVDMGSLTPQPTPSPTPTAPTTMSPTADCLMGRTREQFLLDTLTPITEEAVLTNPSSPQGMAFQWLLGDAFTSDLCLVDTIDQRYGLATFFYSTNGNAWTNSSQWLEPVQECTWAGLYCGTTGNRVIKMDLPFNNVDGPLPDEISTLFNLERIDLFANSVSSTIPAGISNLTDLILFDVERNFLSGPAFTQEILGLSSLIALRLSANSLTGSIPEEITQLDRLQQLWVAENQLVGSLPTVLGDLSDLQNLLVYSNQIDGTLPSELGRLTDLTELQLYENLLNGAIPDEIYQAVNLRTMRLEFNFFDGNINTAIGQLQALTDLRLDNNFLTGEIPSEVGMLTALENFIVNNNFLFGPVPNVFQQFQALEFFDLTECFFLGPVPDSIFDIPTIRFVYLSNNTFIGTLPANFANAPVLRDLYVDGNSLTGTIPSVASGQLLELNEFLLQFNDITGQMPQSICDLRFIGILDDLFTDCGGANPEVMCDFPDCCNRCFEGTAVRRERTREMRQ